MAQPLAPSGAHEKFAFDTVFEASGHVIHAAPRPKRSYTTDEVEAIRKAAEAAGEARAMASIANRQADALTLIARASQQALPGLAAVAHEHRVGSAELALACAKAIAAAALDKFPHAPVRAALEALAREVEAAPRLIVTGDAELQPGLQAVLEETAQAVGYPGAIQVRVDPIATPHAFTLDFGDGSASFDPAAAAERVSQALHAALAAEGLHAEPLIPGAGAPPEVQEPES
ncbi:MAG TPA: flagellar assembly protein FliH [Phenylobacterium sp.]|uniref:flagellar assembly protein FliH n=1 Tax=Phenylobacterium sp. TaxID=1871053 RepID=UPI002D6278FA|nr:flagellar assembly protein FliH [Phenylobacterium sp.]HZZ68737.1 flagellar assembly protein FliH [Phenylobacterium sp.]